jgi:predicted Zn finger-like uncharacterized protein
MIIECSGCRKRYAVDEAKIPTAGGRFKCKNCDSIVEIGSRPADGIAAGEKGKPDRNDAGPYRKKRIIVADDTAFFRIMIADLLSAAGYEVITAVDGEDALDKIKHELPAIDLVVLDMLMPKMDGFQVIEELKREAASENLSILALTGVFKSDADREHMKELGVAGYVDKSTPPELILDRIKMTLGDIADGW